MLEELSGVLVLRVKRFFRPIVKTDVGVMFAAFVIESDNDDDGGKETKFILLFTFIPLLS